MIGAMQGNGIVRVWDLQSGGLGCDATLLGRDRLGEVAREIDVDAVHDRNV